MAFGLATKNLKAPPQKKKKLGEQGSGCMKTTDRTLRLVNGGVQLDFGVEKASHVSNGWLQMEIFCSEPW